MISRVIVERNAAQQVNGIWFYNSHECVEVANLFSRILNSYSNVPSHAKESSSKSEIEKLEGPPTIASLEGPLEPSSTTDPTEFPDEFSFSNFFNSGMTLGNNTSNVGNPWQLTNKTCKLMYELRRVHNRHILKKKSMEVEALARRTIQHSREESDMMMTGMS